MDTVEQIKQRLDIIEIMSEYIKLKPGGGNSMKALCPFHQEKTPSFYVSRDKQLWTCFGCQAGGDMFTFVMKMENMDFSETLRYLAEKAGVEIQRFVSVDANRKTRLADLMDLSAKFYHKSFLESESGVITRDYLKTREVPDELIESFLLGYAPDLWDELAKFLKNKGFREEEMIDAGIAVRKKDGTSVYDRFRHRLMFPIADARGKIVGFTGRQLDGSREGGKYINTPQTLLYNKSQVLYGLHLARQSAKKVGHIIVVEGNMDVIASHKAGVEQVVASSGTALTVEQIILIKRFTDTILMCFDADPAGENAAKRGIDAALEAGMNVRVITLPEGLKDPDDCVRQDPEMWKKVISQATDVMTYYFKKVFAAGLPKTAEEKKRVGKLLLPEIARLQDPIERTHWIQELSTRLGVEDSVLAEALGRMKKIVKTSDIRYQTSDTRSQTPELNRHAKLSEAFLALLITRPELREFLTERIKPEFLPEKPYQMLYGESVSVYNNIEQQNGDYFSILRQKMTAQSPETVRIFDRISLYGESSYTQAEAKEVKEEAERIVQALLEMGRRDLRTQLTQEMAQAEASGDKTKVEELTKRFSELL